MKTSFVAPLFLIISFILSFAPICTAQDNISHSDHFSSKKIDAEMQQYLLKSKRQKRMAWILLGGGIVVNSIGSSIAVNSAYDASGAYDALSTIGGLATIGSIPLFFASSKNHNKARLLNYQKSILETPDDSTKRIYLEDASEYFIRKGTANSITGIALSAVGGAFLVAAIAESGKSDDQGFIFGSGFNTLVYTSMAISCGLISIPFYVRAANLRGTARTILRTGRIPNMDFSSVTPVLKGGQYVAIGVNIPL